MQRDAVANLTAMVAEAALRVRINLAEAVKHLPDGPRDIVLRLAHDPAVMVCEPVIRFSPMLTQEDLVTLIASGPPPSTIMAVASRPQIGATVSDAIVGTANTAAISALLANPTAQIREATLDALAAQSEEQTDWQAPLVHRPHLAAACAAHAVGNRDRPSAGGAGRAQRSRSQGRSQVPCAATLERQRPEPCCRAAGGGGVTGGD